MENFEMNTDLIILIVVCVIVICPISYFIRIWNTLTRLGNKVKELDSDVDVALEKRYDLLKKQYDTVKMYCSYESRTLMETIGIRSGMSYEEKNAASEKLNELSKQLKVIMEAYPKLRSSENAAILQRSCDNAEEHLQAARRLYNTSVTNYNNMCLEFPSSIVARLTGHKIAKYFKSKDETRNDVEFL